MPNETAIEIPFKKYLLLVDSRQWECPVKGSNALWAGSIASEATAVTSKSPCVRIWRYQNGERKFLKAIGKIVKIKILLFPSNVIKS